MNRDETLALLRARSALTSQPYGDDVVDAWLDALGQWSFGECRAALILAARADKRVAVADIVERVPKRSVITPPEAEHWQGPTDGGRAIIAEIRRRFASRPTPGHPGDCGCLRCSLTRHPGVSGSGAEEAARSPLPGSHQPELEPPDRPVVDGPAL